MGKFKNLTSIKSARRASFTYTPPDAAFGALRTLIKIDATVLPLETLSIVLRGLRRVNPLGRLVIVDDFASREAFDATNIIDLMDDEMRASTIKNLIMRAYENTSPQPERYDALSAPEYFGDYECVLSISSFTDAGAALANLSNGFVEGRLKETAEQIEVDRVDELSDVYFSIGHFVHGAVVDLGEATDKIIWGDDLLAVDETAYRTAGEPLPAYFNTIRQLKQQISGS